MFDSIQQMSAPLRLFLISFYGEKFLTSPV